MLEILQQIAVGMIVLLAAIYVARRSWRSLRGRSGGCASGCGGCPSNKQTDKVVVELRNFNVPKR